jgi:hypothetical protein
LHQEISIAEVPANCGVLSSGGGNTQRETRGKMSTFLLILHGLLAVALLGSITHQAVAVVWPARSKAGFVNAYRSVSSRAYVNANIVLFLVVASLGGYIYPIYRVWVRTYMENARLFPAVGSFEIKEQFIAIGLGMLPLYWLVWRRPDPASDSARTAVTLIFCFIVWFAFIVGHILNNIRGFFGL